MTGEPVRIDQNTPVHHDAFAPARRRPSSIRQGNLLDEYGSMCGTQSSTIDEILKMRPQRCAQCGSAAARLGAVPEVRVIAFSKSASSVIKGTGWMDDGVVDNARCARDTGRGVHGASTSRVERTSPRDQARAAASRSGGRQRRESSSAWSRASSVTQAPESTSCRQNQAEAAERT